MSATLTSNVRLNGVNVCAVQELIDSIQRDSANAQTRWNVTTRWQSGTVSESEITGYDIGGRRVRRNFKLRIDEPFELGGTNHHANPQEYLLTALNASMTVGYVALCTLAGIELESLEIDTQGDIDLRGFLGDPTVRAGYPSLHYRVRIKGNGTPEQFEEIHRKVIATSPNYFNVANPIKLTSDLVVE